MIILNLVSAEQKKEIKLRHIYGLIKKINLTLVIIAIAIAITLLSAKVILQSKFNEIVEQTTLVTKTNQGYNNSVREINNKLNFVAEVQNDFIPWSKLLAALALTTPGDISFYYLKIDAEAKTIKIKGRALRRDSLLGFKNRLADNASFKEIDFPIQNILEKENIDFEINAKLDLSSI
ncbi:MAG: hypothetical protein Q7R92_00150 [bacterium]|nr:hypothetical protein [bacterium]